MVYQKAYFILECAQRKSAPLCDFFIVVTRDTNDGFRFTINSHTSVYKTLCCVYETKSEKCEKARFKKEHTFSHCRHCSIQLLVSPQSVVCKYSCGRLVAALRALPTKQTTAFSVIIEYCFSNIKASIRIINTKENFLNLQMYWFNSFWS